MRGKNKCKILKEIRQKIADENDIPYVTRECTYQGECSGTCPKCEAELRYLEQQLEKRQRLGKRVTVAALAASLMTGLVGCPEGNPTAKRNELVGDVPFVESTAPSTACDTEGTEKPGVIEQTEETAEVVGEVAYDPETWDTDVTAGVPPLPDEYEELEGDVAYVDPDEIEIETTMGMIAADETDLVEEFTQEDDG